jgi:hypothetical protein
MQIRRTQAPSLQDLLERYECGAVAFSGDSNASYERHLVFDHVVDPEAASLASVSDRRPCLRPPGTALAQDERYL